MIKIFHVNETHYFDEFIVLSKRHYINLLPMKIKTLFDDPPKVAQDHKMFITENYSKKAIGKKMHERFQELHFCLHSVCRR